MHKKQIALILFTLFLTATLHAATTRPASTQPAFENDIQAFEAADRKSPPPQNAFLFVGSSSIRMWTSLPRDFPDLTLINRGFGGSTIRDNIRYAHRIVTLYKPQRILFYAGDNDLANNLSPEQLLSDFQTFVKTVRTELPNTPIDFIAIKPSPSRIRLLEKARQANALIQAYTKESPNLSFIDVFTPMLSPDGAPRAELFLPDRLHLNPQGYALWTFIVRAHLHLPPAPSTQKTE